MIYQSTSPPVELVDAVRRATRRASFDFAAAALEVRREASELHPSVQGGPSQWTEIGMRITADECREIFSFDFKAKVENLDVSQEPLRPELHYTTSSSRETITYEDIIRVQEELEGTARQNYERVFQRVYQSLGLHEQRGDTQEAYRLPTTNEVLMALERRTAEKQQKEREALIAQQERLEAERLRTERDRLRRRFDEDSEDAQGVDPLGSLPREIIEDPTFDRIRAIVSPHANDNLEPPLPSMHTLTSFFDSPEFEAVLVEVERELEISADGKFGVGNGEDGDSEMAEVLRILESAPKPAASGAATTIDGEGELHELLMKLWPQPQKAKSDGPDDAVGAEKPSLSANQALPPPPPPVAAAIKGGPVGIGPRAGRVGRMFDPSVQPSGHSDEAVDSAASVGSGDDSELDEDWSNRRAAMKSARQGSGVLRDGQHPPPLPAVWSSGQVPSLRTRRAKKRGDVESLSKRTPQRSLEVDDSSQEESDSDEAAAPLTNKSTSTSSVENGSEKSCGDSMEVEVVAKVIINEDEEVADRGGIFGSLSKCKPSESSPSTGSLRGVVGIRSGGASSRMQGRFASSISAAKSQMHMGAQS